MECVKDFGLDEIGDGMGCFVPSYVVGSKVVVRGGCCVGRRGGRDARCRKRRSGVVSGVPCISFVFLYRHSFCFQCLAWIADVVLSFCVSVCVCTRVCMVFRCK